MPTYAHAEGYSTGYLTVFIGLDLQPSAGALDEGERLERVILSFEELLSMVNRNIGSLLVEYPGIDHFSLPSLGQAWADAAAVLRGFLN